MKLSISNIGWDESLNDEVLSYISSKGYSAIEIAPTVYIKENPYDNVDKMIKIKNELKNKYNLGISSMQSIWYGKTGNIFNESDAKELMEYTKKAIDFASQINCNNLVFGCPKNRCIPEDKKISDIVYFFKELGDYAYSKNTVFSIEPNPTIYNTNFINTTKEAFELVKLVNSKGLKVNVDFGTIIENNEDADIVINNLSLVNHIHISEPYLEKIKMRDIHKLFSEKLKNTNYNGYVSIEMKKQDNIEDIKNVIDYVYDIFN